MVRKVIGNVDVSFIDSPASSGLQLREQTCVAIGLRIILVAGIQRASSQRNADNMIRTIVLLAVLKPRFRFTARTQRSRQDSSSPCQYEISP